MLDSSQGTSCPVADSITEFSRVSAGVSATEDDTLYRRIIGEWSPRRTLRLDGAGTHEYRQSTSAPLTAPTCPWALYLADSDHRYRLLAFDFDTAKHGPGAAKSDADTLSSQLTELGAQHLRTTSGPTGGQHIWLRLTAGADPDSVRSMARALIGYYPTLDIAPLCNPATGVVRGPGSPHRSGGQSIPHQQGTALHRTLDDLRAGTTPEIVEWLLARHPHTPTATTRRTPIRIVNTVDGPRLDRPRRGLSPRTKSLMNTTLMSGSDRSNVAYSILLGMARAGHTLKDAAAASSTAPGLARLREDREAGRSDTLAKQWDKALTAAATFAPVTDQMPTQVDAELDAIENCLHANAAEFARPGGPSDERILHALAHLARTARTRTLDIDCRRLAQLTGLDASTISRRLRALTAQEWVTPVRPGAGAQAATWTLNQPPARYLCTAATQVEHAPAPNLLTHHAHDLWTPNPGLGAAYARIHFFLLTGLSTIEELAQATGYAPRTVRTALAVFKAQHLLPTARGTDQIRRGQLHTAAQRLGVAGHLASRALRHTTERTLWTWWSEEIAWRTRSGPKRGPRRQDIGSLPLPIPASPRATHGRFPTTGGRADYRRARAMVLAHHNGTSILSIAC
ncbi:UNVERIFIED_ORG: hypothetical protein FNL38_1114 [Nocardia globerula]|uniref:Uncharacterized protein n=1 Tax=Nocardia globerula TaxID=1818 RepID=A0A652YI32_NOCGL